MSDSITGGFSFLYSTLTGDATFMGYVSGVWADFAPQGTNPDFCIVASQSPTDILGSAGTRIMSRNLFQVKIVGPIADYSNISTAYARADTLLQPLHNTGGIISCVREHGLYVPEIVDGVPWVSLGGLYRIEL